MARTLLTTDELAERVRTVPGTVRYWRHKGVGPQGVKVGRKVLYDEADVEAWLNTLAAQERGGDAA
jgi:excisionase family DNA binding protein